MRINRLSGEAAKENRFYCAMIAPRSGKRRIRLKVANKPIAQKSSTALRSGSSHDHSDAF